METVLVQINDSKAYKLLKDLEALNLIKVLGKNRNLSQKLSVKYAGKLPEDVVDALQLHVIQSRSEWDKDSIS